MANEEVLNGYIPREMISGTTRANGRLKVDVAQAGFFEGREFRLIRKFTSPTIFKFVAPIEFILSFQGFSAASGDFEFYAWRGDNVTEDTPFNTEVPVFGKNNSSTRPRFDGAFYQRQCQVFTGGTITVTDSNLYADYERLKIATATGQQQTIEGSGREERYLAPGNYYLQFTGVAEASLRLTWEERP